MQKLLTVYVKIVIASGIDDRSKQFIATYLKTLLYGYKIGKFIGSG